MTLKTQQPANERPRSAYLHKYSVVQTFGGWTLVCTTIGPYWYRKDRAVRTFETEAEALDGLAYVTGERKERQA